MKTGNLPTKRSHVINLRFLPQDVIKLQKMAEQKGLPLSTFCYLIIKNTIDKESAQ